jgi:hypothetical protein
VTEKIDGLPVIDVDESERIMVAVRTDDLLEGDMADPASLRRRTHRRRWPKRVAPRHTLLLDPDFR